MKRIVVGISGASGGVMGVRLLAALRQAGVETHLVVTPGGWRSLARETSLTRGEIEAQASVCYAAEDLDAAIASGTFPADGMVVCPCSMGTVSAIANGTSDNLLERAADVVIKERGQLILVPRESPFSAIHLENMLKLARLGVTIMPAAPGFYHEPKSIEDLVDFMVARILDHLGVEHELTSRWGYANH